MKATDPDFAARRQAMVKYQLAGRGVHDGRVLEAMARVPREAFVPDHLADEAYEDHPLPIGHGQTISQPYIVALMAEVLELTGRERVLDIGTGSGYAAAVLASLALEVYSIERIPELAGLARRNLDAAGFSQVHVVCGDGTLGWPEAAPFDGICVAAGAPIVPESLKQQLAIGGRMVIPVGPEQSSQQLVVVTRRSEHDYQREDFGDVRFVPLVGEEGWS